MSEMNCLNIPIAEVTDEKSVLLGISKDELIRSIVVDSRKIHKGDWFICLKGENNDSHDFIAQAMAAGAAGIIYERRAISFTPNYKGIQVVNTLEFLSRLGSYWRNKVNPIVIGITGSNGKTSVKEIIAFLLEKCNLGSVCKSSGNFNNQFGVPFTLLSLKPYDKFLVIEIGTNHPGEIKRLSFLASPDYAVITSVSPGHIGNFGSIESIFEEKSDIMAGLKKGGGLFVHRNVAENSTVQKKAAFFNSQIKIAAEKLSVISSDDSGINFSWNGQTFHFSLCGKHQFKNLQLAFSVVSQMIPDVEKLTEALKQLAFFVPVKGRLQKNISTPYNVWDDSYNANPESFSQAISFLSGISSSADICGAFGMMGELGDYSIQAHENLGREAASALKAVFFSSEDKEICEAFLHGWHSVKSSSLIFIAGNCDQDIQKGCDFLKANLKEADHVLVKGSRSTRMERIFKYFES